MKNNFLNYNEIEHENHVVNIFEPYNTIKKTYDMN